MDDVGAVPANAEPAEDWIGLVTSAVLGLIGGRYVLLPGRSRGGLVSGAAEADQHFGARLALVIDELVGADQLDPDAGAVGELEADLRLREARAAGAAASGDGSLAGGHGLAGTPGLS